MISTISTHVPVDVLEHPELTTISRLISANFVLSTYVCTKSNKVAEILPVGCSWRHPGTGLKLCGGRRVRKYDSPKYGISTWRMNEVRTEFLKFNIPYPL